MKPNLEAQPAYENDPKHGSKLEPFMKKTKFENVV